MIQQSTTNKPVRVSFISLGCFKNIVDTEVLGGFLEGFGLRVVSSYEETDWLVINTCGFIRDAREESIDEIFMAMEKKEKGEVKHVAVFGCLVQRYLEEIKTTFKSVDILWGVNDLKELARLIRHAESSEYNDKTLFLYNDKNKRIITTTPNSTFIKISEGCDMQCSFCAIPGIRGPYRSREIHSILREAEKYKSLGFEEINLISQNSTYFGKDRSEQSQLPNLLKEISKLKFNWVRVLYLMPEEVNDRIIDAFTYPSIVPYFDLPFQHVSEKILKKMKRAGGFLKNMNLIHKIRKQFHDAVIRSTFIVGFPGETQEDFNQLCQFAEASRIEYFGVFAFSPEEGTEAFQMKKRASTSTVLRREAQLMDISDRNLEQFHRSIMNTIQEFISLGPWSNNSTIGRIRSQAPEVDGLTQVSHPFHTTTEITDIEIIDSQHELLLGKLL